MGKKSGSQTSHDTEAAAVPYANEARKPDSPLGIRHMQAFLLFLGLALAYALRVILSLAIVAMTDQKSTGVDFPEYDWGSDTKSTILSSFFWGYVVTQVPAGQLAQMFGPKILLVGALFVTSFFTLLTPVSADLGDWGLVCGCRVVQGLSQGFIFPSLHTLLSSWTPAEERGRLVTYVYAGAQVGTIIAMPICGALASSSLGWPSIFYIFGGIGIAWSILWQFLGADRPSTSKFITPEEIAYIEASTGSHNPDRKLVAPFLEIFTSLPMWALIIAHSGQNWGFWTLLTEMPTYMNGVLNFDLKSNSLLSALPYLVMWILSFGFSWVSDFIMNKNYVTKCTSRKIFNSIGHWIPGIALIALAFPTGDGNTTLPVALLTLAVGVNSATYVGFQVNHIDLSPNYAGTMMGITNCASNIMSIIAPLLVGQIVTDEHDDSQWRIVFFIASGIYFAGNLFFVLFGKADIQVWNDPDYNSKTLLKLWRHCWRRIRCRRVEESTNE